MAITIRVKERLYNYNLKTSTGETAFLVIKKGFDKEKEKYINKLISDSIKAETISSIVAHDNQDGKSFYNFYMLDNNLLVFSYLKYESPEDATQALYLLTSK